MMIPMKLTRVSNSPGSNWSGLDLKKMSFIIRELCQKHSIPVAVFCIGNCLFRIQSIWSFGVLIDRRYFFLPANSVVPAGKLSCQNFHISTEECEHKLCLGNYLAVASVCGGQWKAMTPELQCAWRVSNLSGRTQNQVVLHEFYKLFEHSYDPNIVFSNFSRSWNIFKGILKLGANYMSVS